MRLLLAEDSTQCRERLLLLLSQIAGVEIVRAAEDGTQALDAARTLLPDVAILDIQMPGASGLEVLHAIRREPNGMVVIMLTNHSDEHYRQKCKEMGADHFFLKSGSSRELIDLVQSLTVKCQRNIGPNEQRS